MSEAEVERLLREGLDYYGRGDGVRAVECWEEALRRDPGNTRARDYLEAARSEDTAPGGAADGAAPEREAFAFGASVEGDDPALAELGTRTHRARVRALEQEAQQLLREERLEEALDLFRTAAGLDPSRVELDGYVDMVRSRLLKRYREHIGDGARRPRVAVDSRHITRYNLPPDAGFVLSLVDGRTSYDEIVSLSGMDAFETLRILERLLRAGIVAADE